jgi:hypothetical protein
MSSQLLELAVVSILKIPQSNTGRFLQLSKRVISIPAKLVSKFPEHVRVSSSDLFNIHRHCTTRKPYAVNPH